MFNMNIHRHMFEKRADLLIHSFILNSIFAFSWFCFYKIFAGSAFKVHSKIFDISRHEFTIINYCGIGLLKLLNVFFYLVPFIAIKKMMVKKC
jgi:hypothetical protein